MAAIPAFSLPYATEPLPADWDGKVVKFYSRPFSPAVIDIHHDDETQPEPKIRAFAAYDAYLNQLWILKGDFQNDFENTTSPNWTLQNVGTGFFLGTNTEGKLQAKKDLDRFYLAISNANGEVNVLIQKTLTSWVVLSGGDAGHILSHQGYNSGDKAEDGILWRVAEYNLAPDQLKLAAEARAAAEEAEAKAAAPPPAAAAALTLPVGGQVSDEKTVQLLNLKGGCPNALAWKRTDGGFICSGGGHRITDAQLAAAA